MRKTSWLIISLILMLPITACGFQTEPAISVTAEPTAAPATLVPEIPAKIAEQTEAPIPSQPLVSTAVPDNGKITVDDIGIYTEAPAIIYSTSADENGMGDKLMYANGRISRFFMESGYKAFEFVSDYGNIAILNVVTEDGWDELTERDGVRAYFSYMGYSSALKMAAGCYYGVIPLDAQLDEIPNSIALGYLATGNEDQ